VGVVGCWSSSAEDDKCYSQHEHDPPAHRAEQQA
jgi:hypothetical protein